MIEVEYKLDDSVRERDLLFRIARDMRDVRNMLVEVVKYMKDAESEVPERMRRFIMYMHDMHDVKNLYDEHGHICPTWVLREVERCDDRLRQLLIELHGDGGVFEKVRREMANDPENRWDHTRLLSKAKEKPNEARPSESQLDWLDQSRAESSSCQS